MAAVVALIGSYGVFLIYTALTFGRRGLLGGTGSASTWKRTLHARLHQWMAQSGLEEARPAELGAAMLALLVLGSGAAFALFASPVAAAAVGLFAAAYPMAAFRARRERRLAAAREAWPRMIEEIRLQTGSLGRSIPTALFEVGRRGPEEMRASFLAGEREWLITTDFPRTIALLKRRLADPTADATFETLLIANEVGGTDVDRRLAALVEDRVQDLQGRKDARSKQAGVRFARRFVLIVPVGMALAGLSIGTGRTAYETPVAQVAVLFGVLAVLACWIWAGRLLRLPEEERVFRE